MSETTLDQAIAKAGGQRAMARALGVSHQTITQWKATGMIPPVRVIAIEKITGIPRETLRPDIYPPEDRSMRRARAADRDLYAAE